MRGGLIVAAAALASIALTSGLCAEEAAAKDNPDRVICKRESITGTRLTKRVCHTAREWEQLRREAQDVMQQHQTHQQNKQGG